MARLGTVRIVDVQDKLCPGVSLELKKHVFRVECDPDVGGTGGDGSGEG